MKVHFGPKKACFSPQKALFSPRKVHFPLNGPFQLGTPCMVALWLPLFVVPQCPMYCPQCPSSVFEIHWALWEENTLGTVGRKYTGQCSANYIVITMNRTLIGSHAALNAHNFSGGDFGKWFFFCGWETLITYFSHDWRLF